MLLRQIVFRSVLCGLSLVTADSLTAGDWPRFRGPNGSGVSTDTAPTPETWSPTENLKWKVALPGAGVSCPIVLGNRLYVTAYSGYGDEGGDQKDLRRHLICLDRQTGKVLWEQSVAAVLPEDPFTGMGVPQHGYASHTPTSDGERIYVFFGKSGVYAYSLDGEELWHHAVGTESDPKRWGSASSPIVVEGIVIVPAGPESRAIVGLDAATGTERWRAPSDSLGNVWGTPAIAKVDETRTDLVIGAPYEIWGLSPQTGKLRWFCEAMETDSFNTSVVVQDGVIYAVEGRSGGSIAVRAGGLDDVTKSHVVWTGRDANRFGTPVAFEDRLYFVSGGIVNCISAKTGEKVFQARLPGGRAAPERAGGPGERPGRGGGRGGTDYASPVIADGKLYYVTNSGQTHVLKAGTKFESLAVNSLTEDAENFAATPAISDGELFFRSNKHLYCVSAAK